MARTQPTTVMPDVFRHPPGGCGQAAEWTPEQACPERVEGSGVTTRGYACGDATRPDRSNLPQPTHGPRTAAATARTTTEYMIWR